MKDSKKFGWGVVKLSITQLFMYSSLSSILIYEPFWQGWTKSKVGKEQERSSKPCHCWAEAHAAFNGRQAPPSCPRLQMAGKYYPRSNLILQVMMLPQNHFWWVRVIWCNVWGYTCLCLVPILATPLDIFPLAPFNLPDLLSFFKSIPGLKKPECELNQLPASNSRRELFDQLFRLDTTESKMQTKGIFGQIH